MLSINPARFFLFIFLALTLLVVSGSAEAFSYLKVSDQGRNQRGYDHRQDQQDRITRDLMNNDGRTQNNPGSLSAPPANVDLDKAKDDKLYPMCANIGDRQSSKYVECRIRWYGEAPPSDNQTNK
ncbi:MAG: hypothetical protein LBS60_15010 [Deltaproteobacteria bacterium]|jgi:hypothetical protein|nr:hypothetical protein [Deltaproteobacteria bacterium]